MHSKNLIHSFMWPLDYWEIPTWIPEALSILTRLHPSTGCPSCRSLSPTTPKKPQSLQRLPRYCLYPHNSSKNTAKIPLALCKHKTFLKGNSLPDIHKSLHPCNFSSTTWFHVRTAARICCKPILFFPQKSTALISTNLKQVHFPQYVYIPHEIQKVILNIKNPTKCVFCTNPANI